MKYNAEDLKRISADLANLLRSEQSIQGFTRIINQQMRLLKDIVLDSHSSDQTVADVFKPSEISNIGIWKPEVKNGNVSFVRMQPAAWNERELGFWADVERINPKAARTRVVLFGESVARGLFIDPHFNCAIALESYLNSQKENKEIEVIDLAQSGQRLKRLKEMLVPALALEPDAYVIFAGNNWHLYEFVSPGDILRIESMLRETASMKPIYAYVEAIFRERISDFVKYLGRFSSENRVPIVFIIPEFNLLDWRVNSGWRNPLATDDLIKQSLYLRTLAEKELAEGNLHLAAALAEEMVQLTEETNPYGFEILSRCNIRQGQVGEARRFKQKALDTDLLAASAPAPMCYSITREVLRQESAQHGVVLVDLPQRFEQHFPHELPGRRFFYDSVHMTVEGICLAMALAAEKLLPLLGCREQSWLELNRRDFAVDRQALAQSHVAAAYLNNAGRQDYEIIHFHCSEALRHAPEIADLMRLCINALVRKTNLKYVNEIERIVLKNGTSKYSFPNWTRTDQIGPYVSSKTLLAEGLCIPLIRSMTDALSEIDTSIKRIVDDMLKEEHGVCSCERDLLQPAYTDVTYNDKEFCWNLRSLCYKAYSSQSCFHLVCECPCSVKMIMTCRVQNANAVIEPVRVLVNGVVCHNFLATEDWTTSTWVVPAELMHDALNSIIVRWPESKQSKKERAQEIASKLPDAMMWSGGDFLDIFFRYGEINELRAFVSKSEPE